MRAIQKPPAVDETHQVTETEIIRNWYRPLHLDPHFQGRDSIFPLLFSPFRFHWNGFLFVDCCFVQVFNCLLCFLVPQMAGGGDPKWQKDAADQNFDYMFKLLIIGNSSVGKTSFLFRYADDSFTSAFVSTVGIDFKVKTVFRHDKRVKLQIWVRKIDILCCHSRGRWCGSI